MAVDTPSISRPLRPAASMDYEQLYLEGLKHIEALSGQLWTDYNAHDPGITILEVLCYAITELGYRTEFEIGDIIQANPADTNLFPANLTEEERKQADRDLKSFFTLGRLGSNAPLTVDDYRKLLIDLPGIRNAWLERVMDPKPDLYYGQPTGQSEPILSNVPMTPLQEVNIKGLYDVYLEFEEHPEYGNLNDNSLSGIFQISPIGVGSTSFEVEIEFPRLEELPAELDEIQELLDNAGPGTEIFELGLMGTQVTQVPQQKWVYEGTLIINPNAKAIELPFVIRVVSGFEKIINPTEFQARLRDEFRRVDPLTTFPALGYLPLTYKKGDPDPEESILMVLKFLKKRQHIQSLLEAAFDTMADHRNLCEDFEHVYPMSLQEIAIDLAVTVEPGTNREQVMAQVYHAVELYLSPTIRFYSLREMLDKGYSPEEIFEGPWLCNGFIDSNEDAFTNRREILYTSDLVQEFMKIEGVQAVNRLRLSRYIRGKREEHDMAECLTLKEIGRVLPKFNDSFSTIKVAVGGGKFEEPNRRKALDLYAEIKAVGQLQGKAGTGDFEVPMGEFGDLEEYYSIQHEFPLNYAIGIEGLAPNETPARKAQARQLKAYLLFFEQLLANYHSQLSNIRKLFSHDPDEKFTYFTQPLLQVPRVRELIRQANGLDDAQYATLIAGASPNQPDFIKKIQGYAEDEETFRDRRLRFLNHLSARFNESFSAYAAYVFSHALPDEDPHDRLIADQARFLRKYALEVGPCVSTPGGRDYGHSNDRATAFNYRLGNPSEPGKYFLPYDPPNSYGLNMHVEGLKKRMVYLTGLPEVARQWINPIDYFSWQFGTTGWGWSLHNQTMLVEIVDSVTPDFYATEGDLKSALPTIIRLLQNRNNYSDNLGTIEVKDGNTLVAVVNAAYRTSFSTMDECVESIVTHVKNIANIENFHIVEHILLRQHRVGDPLMKPRWVECCKELNIVDPYSFRISVVLPNWAGRFADMDFRLMFKQVMRQECPAHVYIHFYWVDPVQMYKFEKCWNHWIDTEWYKEDERLLWEENPGDTVIDNDVDKAVMLQENFYDILIERTAATGEDTMFFVDCLGALCNLGDAHYIIEPERIADKWKKCEVIATVVDPDSPITRAWLAPGSGPLPPGTCLDECTGAIMVVDEALLHQINGGPYPLNIKTYSESGELTCHNIVVKFTLNGPAKVVYPKASDINYHIDNFDVGYEFAHFEDKDGNDPNDRNIVMADLLETRFTTDLTSIFPTYHTWGAPSTFGWPTKVPPGWDIDPITGTMKVANPAALVVGRYILTMSVTDSEGGETTLNVTVRIEPDKEAVAQAKPMLNQDAYKDNDILGGIFDLDGPLTQINLVGTTTLAQMGLRIDMNAVVIAGVTYSHLVIDKIADFQSALYTSFTQVTGTNYFRKYLTFSTKDVKRGVSTPQMELRIRVDRVPVFTPVNYGQPLYKFVNGYVVGRITDTPDDGVASFDPLIPPISNALELVQVGNVVELRVKDKSTFAAYMHTLQPDVNHFASFSFTSPTIIDNTGGQGTVTCSIRARMDQEPVITVLPPKNIDTYVGTEVLATISELDGTGTVNATHIGTPSLSTLGLKLVGAGVPSIPINTGGMVQMRTSLRNGPAMMGLAMPQQQGNPTTRIEIANLATFVTAVTTGPHFTPLTATSKDVKATVVIRTKDSIGFEVDNAIDIIVTRDVEATVLNVKNGQPINNLFVNDVMMRFVDTDQQTSFGGFTSTPPLPNGLSYRLNNGDYEIYVSNKLALAVQVTPITVHLLDNTGGVSDIPVTIVVKKAVIDLYFEFQATAQTHSVKVGSQSPGLVITSLDYNFPPRFGTLSLGDGQTLLFSEGSGFGFSTAPESVNFSGFVPAKSVMTQVEGVLTIECTSVRANVINIATNVKGVSALGSNTILSSTTTTNNQKASQLMDSTSKIVANLGKATNFGDNPNLYTNGKLLENYAAGNYDAKVSGDITAVLVQTADEIVRLKTVVSTSSGQALTQARAELEVFAELYRQQILAATHYAGEIVNGDISDVLKALFEEIQRQNQRIL